MAKGKSSSGRGEAQFSITQANLDNHNKTNKKIKLNPQASKYLTACCKELKEKAEAYAKEHYKKGRRTRIKEQRAKEEAERLAKEKTREKLTKDIKSSPRKQHN